MKVEDLLLLIIIFFAVSLLWYLCILLPKYKVLTGQEETSKKGNKKRNINPFILETAYLNKRFGINSKNLMNKKILLVCSIINAFIITASTAFVWFVPIVLILRLLISFVILFALIFISYEIYGKILIKRGLKDGNKEDWRKMAKVLGRK